MARRTRLAWVVAILAAMAPAAQAQIPISRGLLPTRTALAHVGLERHWMTLVPVSGAEWVLSISMAENMFFAQTNTANFYAYDAESGRLLWSINLGRPAGTAWPASVNSRLVFVTNSNELYALDRATGRVAWITNLNILPTSATACDELQVMVGLSNGKLASYLLYDPGDKQKTLYAHPRPYWNWQTGGGSMLSKAVPAQQFVIFGGLDGKLYVALAEVPIDGIAVMLYRIATGGAIEAPVGTYGARTVLVSSADKCVYAVDLFTATVNWVYPSGAPVLQEPMVAEDEVYAVNIAGLLTALDVKTGTPKWTTSTQGGRLMSISEKRIYLETHDDDMFIVDRGSGEIVASPRVTHERAGLNLRDYNLGITNSINDRLYIATKSGVVMCLREIGQIAPRPLRDPKQPPFGFVPPEGAILPPTQTTPAESTEPAAAPAPADAAAPANP